MEKFTNPETDLMELTPEARIIHDHPEAISSLGQSLEGLRNSPSYINMEEIENACQGNAQLEKLFEGVKEQCLYYTETVCRFQELALNSDDLEPEAYRQEMANIDNARKRKHDAMIADMQILARQMRKAGQDITWVAKLQNRNDFARAALMFAYSLMMKVAEDGNKPNSQGVNHE